MTSYKDDFPELAELEKSLGYKFKNRHLLDEACRHSSYVNEHPDIINDNERMEFLGDAVLSLAVSHLLMERFPDLNEGKLSRMRANLVNERSLARIAKTLNLGKYLRLGKGELQTQGQEKSSILADAFEAVLAGIYMDRGFKAAFCFVKSRFDKMILSMNTPKANHYDYKSKLQELVQVHGKTMPAYKVIQESGPDHDKTFTIQIEIGGVRAVGVGKSKKNAEQEAAKQALSLLEKQKK